MHTEITPFSWQEFNKGNSRQPAFSDIPSHDKSSSRLFRRASDHQYTLPEYQERALHDESSANAKPYSGNTLTGAKAGIEPKSIYMGLNQPEPSQQVRAVSQDYLSQQLALTREMDCDLPEGIEGISAWIDHNNDAVGRAYREYLQARRAGGPRQYFTTKAHALNFLQSVAPTKLVDGSWLYGFVHQWQDPRFLSLTKIYLEELGEGQPSKNHVVLYKKLLNDNECDQWQGLGEEYFIQGATQLALGHHVSRFLPEAIGYNLGYEQLPLHLLITAYELNELDIGPYYFTLHVTVDNASTGHARKSLQALMDSAPVLADKAAYYQRVKDGYKLNQLGLGTNDIISGFNLEQELMAVLAAKSNMGQHMHSDFCRIEGRTVNEWLSDPDQIPQFVENLVNKGWIKRHEDPSNSRFWKLLDGEHAEMFGVFNAYERQVIYDWIAGDALSKGGNVPEQTVPASIQAESMDGEQAAARGPGASQPSFRMKQMQAERQKEQAQADGPAGQRERRSKYINDDHYKEADSDVRALEEKLATMDNKADIMRLLANLMSPAIHHTPVGLTATRLYKAMLEKYCNVRPQPLSVLLVSDTF